MIDIRPFASLGAADHGWLDARHHFSFASYHDPQRMGWGSIRVWNDDTIAAQTGFPPHPHRDMEIVTFVRTGAITHRDSLGNEGRTAAGDVQVMSAGTGITHSEYNLEDEETTLFQIWIIPDRQGEKPSWGQRQFPKASREGAFEILASGTPEADEALAIRTDAKVAAATLKAGQKAVWRSSEERHQYLVAPTGKIRVNGHDAEARDGIALTGEAEIIVEALEDSEVVLVDAR
ncbi:pirin family protein [Altererythrobacter arenosus]|uniref:Pirin family protein n=1 Tax=Altererythrobacter arenosus TaxID=3032592 RepID=A0ABY8FQZ0_9SPHN|nr:pirin-like bicupin family protein [Altererythrobacter sp. CAU 1644]WFL77182.1 pirin family protein [Altererythrobacter sp. CAU 1644]